MIADCNERQEARRELTTARALMKPTETNLIGDLVGALLSVFFLCGARCRSTVAVVVHVHVYVHVHVRNVDRRRPVKFTRTDSTGRSLPGVWGSHHDVLVDGGSNQRRHTNPAPARVYA